MPKKSVIPDAWDDDWEAQADKLPEETTSVKQEEAKVVTKSERLAQHADANKKLWQSAEEPETFHFLETKPIVPLKAEFKPALKVLARKPQPTMIKRVDPVTGLEQMTLEEVEDDQTEQKVQLTPDEIRAKTQRERGEKQRRYDEARARILGSGSGSSTPGNITPPGGEITRGKGRGRGGNGGLGGASDVRRPDSRSGTKELYDPNYSPKPVTLQKRNAEQSRSGRSTPKEDDQIIRAPKGPNASGKGFGFAKRGDQTS